MTGRVQERDRINREELTDRIAATVREDGIADPMEGLRFSRASQPTERVCGVSKPSLCVIAQGAKEVFLADTIYRYDTESYLLATVELPVMGRVAEASVARPYLAVRIELDPMMVGSVMVEAGIPSAPNGGEARAVVVRPLESDLFDAVVRLVRSFDTPRERLLLPSIKREIVFRLLTSQQGSRLRHLPMLGGHSDRITQALEKLRKEFHRPVSIDRLARDLGMSSSGFHHHFKAVTDMSPLQYQKQLRLQEARRLMLGEQLDAASAGYKVGYDDPSHFSRDYKKLFGHSPIRDVERLRSMVTAD